MKRRPPFERQAAAIQPEENAMRRLSWVASISLLMTGRWVMAQTADTIYYNGPIITIN
jgi:hypothetical protein